MTVLLSILAGLAAFVLVVAFALRHGKKATLAPVRYSPRVPVEDLGRMAAELELKAAGFAPNDSNGIMLRAQAQTLREAQMMELENRQTNH